MFSTIAAGPLTAFPIYSAQLQAAGVLSSLCPDGEATCDAQAQALGTVYQMSQAIFYCLFLPAGYVFDKMGPRNSAVCGAVFASFWLVVLPIPATQ